MKPYTTLSGVLLVLVLNCCTTGLCAQTASALRNSDLAYEYLLAISEPVYLDQEEGSIVAVAQDSKASDMTLVQLNEARHPLPDFADDLSVLANPTFAQTLQLATAYRLRRDWENAVVWYAKVVEVSKKSSHKFFYEKALAASGRKTTISRLL